jgi:transposase InsO family protein
VVCIPHQSDIRLSLLHDAHDSLSAGHHGFDKVFDKLRHSVYWPHMARDTHLYIKTCESCQCNKSSHERPAGLLQPLEIPTKRWATVTMDFIVQLPKTSRGYDMITVFVDKLTKMAHFVPGRTNYAASDVAQQFYDTIFRHHGMPTLLVSDRDPKFTGKFWTELHCLLNVRLALSSAFHPQTDGQTERVNQSLEVMLRAYINHCQTNWDLLLTGAEFAYNDSVHASTGFTPFY